MKTLVVVSPRPTSFETLQKFAVTWTVESPYSVSGLVPSSEVEAVKAVCHEEGWDAAAFTSRPKLTDFSLLAMDLDITTIDNETLDEIAEMTGTGDKVKAITAEAMTGRIDYVTSLKERVATLAGHPLSLIDRVIEDKLTLQPGVADWVKLAKTHGLTCLLISGGFQPVVDHFVKTVGFDAGFGNHLESTNGVLTGHLTGPLVDANFKGSCVKTRALQQKISREKIIAIGDGANDLAMIGAAGLAIGYRPKPKLAKHCDICLYYGDYRNIAFFFAPI